MILRCSHLASLHVSASADRLRGGEHVQSFDHYSRSATVYGPFRRLEAPKGQTARTAVEQALSGEIWGEVPRHGITPTVEAYPGELKDGESGIEFWAFGRPDTRFGPRPRWFQAGAFLTIEEDGGREVAKLLVAFVRITQDLLEEAATWTAI